MTLDQPRTDATSRDPLPDHQYTLSIEETAETGKVKLLESL